MKKSSVGLLIALSIGLVASATPVLAQEEQPVAEDPIFENLFPPELIMQHRRAIDLSDVCAGLEGLAVLNQAA